MKLDTTLTLKEGKNKRSFFIGPHVGYGMFTLRIPKFITSIVDTELKEEGSYQSGRNAYYGITIGKKIPLKNPKLNLELFIGGGSSQSNYKYYNKEGNRIYENPDIEKNFNQSGEELVYRGGLNVNFQNLHMKICILGLGYVGLPLSFAFSKVYNVVGYDPLKKRIDELKKCNDINGEFSKKDFKKNKNLTFTDNKNEIKDCNIYIITVPTPIKENKEPDLRPLLKASKIVGKNLSKSDIVIYESTVYPGCTEEKCVPILEMYSNLIFNKDFFCGYSPERINPGDKNRKLTDIIKVTSGSNEATSVKVDLLYKKIISAGTYLAESIKIAEASKIIENIQRDVNISLMNELAIIFNKMDLDTKSVLKASSTKWNFLNFIPGLVGGHCIGVDPYYLAHKAKELNYNPKVILSGRKVNNKMGKHIAASIIKLLLEKNKEPKIVKL